jgi:predicted membrane channel-forming protein YqfA (hemolysin III family)
MSEQAIRVSADAKYHCINIKSLKLQYCLPECDYLMIKVIMLLYIIDHPKKVKSKEYMLRVSG